MSSRMNKWLFRLGLAWTCVEGVVVALVMLILSPIWITCMAVGWLMHNAEEARKEYFREDKR